MEAKDEIKVNKQKLETYNEKEEEEDQIEKNNFFEVAIDNDEIFKVCNLIHEIFILKTKLSTTLHTILQGTHIQH